MENEVKSVKNFGDNQTESSKGSSIKINFNNEMKDDKYVEPNCKISSFISQVSLVNNSGCNISGSPKMGSRRIFTPQFKIQVLESYRNDSDCKGNQRATARKYNIHRRQIQKWLQCESSLRSSVANINHNTVKHQFHNISMQQQRSQKLSIPDNSSYGSSNQHSGYLSLDSSRQTVIPSLDAPSSSQKQEVFAAADLSVVVAAAAGVMSITSSSSTASTSAPTKTVVSPLRPSAIIGTSRNTSATMSPVLHQHHYGIPPFSPAGIPISVPILTNHISHPRHIHQQNQQPHQSYQCHNLAYTRSLIHQPENKQSFVSPVSLPIFNALSAVSVSTNNGFAKGEIKYSDLENAPQLNITTSSDLMLENNCYVDREEILTTYAKCGKSTEAKGTTNVSGPYSVYQFSTDEYSLVCPHGPMDLSLRPRREVKAELLNVKSNVHCYETRQPEKAVQNCLNCESNIVDLTYRKRKVANISNTVDEFKDELPEKQAKLISATERETNKCIIINTTEFCVENVPNTESCYEEDDSEIEVGTEEKISPSKPVKLFKPYLLDDCDDNSDNNAAKCSESEQINTSEKSLWTSCTKSVSPSQFYSDISVESYRENTFRALTNKYSAIHENTYFLGEIRTGSLQSAFSPTVSVPTLSPTTFQCPKGSPISSGYESSTSTYSESSLSSRSEAYAYGQNYSINLQMHTIYNDNIVLQPSKQVQRWLDQEESNPPAHNSSIALFD